MVFKTKMSLEEFLYAFIRGVLKLQCTPVIVVYLLCVALAPLWIRNIRPFGLRKVLVFYNFSCSVMSLYSVVFVIKALRKGWPYSLVSLEEDALVKHAFWVYYMTKYIELMDTVFMILRHRARQISVLHVYHHTSILMLSEYAYIRGSWPSLSVPVGLNALIHVFLYFYYGQSALYPSKRPAWKKNLTQLQLLQFFVGLCQMIVGYLGHGFCFHGILYELSMIGLFSNFYYHAYIKEKPTNKLN